MASFVNVHAFVIKDRQRGKQRNMEVQQLGCPQVGEGEETLPHLGHNPEGLTLIWCIPWADYINLADNHLLYPTEEVLLCKGRKHITDP